MDFEPNEHAADGVTAGHARHNSSNVGGVTAAHVGHNSSYSNIRINVYEFSYVRPTCILLFLIIVLTNGALCSHITRCARTSEAIDNIRTFPTIFTRIRTAFVYICNIPTATRVYVLSYYVALGIVIGIA